MVPGDYYNILLSHSLGLSFRGSNCKFHVDSRYSLSYSS